MQILRHRKSAAAAVFLAGLALTLASVLLWQPKVFCEVRITPGSLTRGIGMSRRLVDTPNAIAALISAGTFNDAIRERLVEAGVGDPSPRISVSIEGEWPANEQVVVRCTARDRKSGILALEMLVAALKEEYRPLVEAVEAAIDSRMAAESQRIVRIDVDTFESQRRIFRLENQLAENQQREVEIRAQREQIAEELESLSNAMTEHPGAPETQSATIERMNRQIRYLVLQSQKTRADEARREITRETGRLETAIAEAQRRISETLPAEAQRRENDRQNWENQKKTLRAITLLQGPRLAAGQKASRRRTMAIGLLLTTLATATIALAPRYAPLRPKKA